MNAPKAAPALAETTSDTEHPGSGVDDTALGRLIGALAEHGSEVHEDRKPDGQAYIAQCPAHEDGKPSLAVFDHGSRLGLWCRAGCDRAEVVRVLGLSMADLFSAAYPYEDGRVVRRLYDADGRKTFRQENGKGPSVLYRRSEVVAAVADGAPIYLVEGEKDAETLISLGVVATTAPGGASSFGKVDVTPLAGAQVVAIPDEDDAGSKWLGTVLDKLRGIAHRVEVRRVAAGVNDVTDHIESGHALAELVPWSPPRHPRTEAILSATLDASELDKLPKPTPLLAGLLNASEYVLLSGKFGTYKSFAALGWAFSLATGKPWSSSHPAPVPRPVVYVAAEGVSGILKRLRALERLHGVTVPPGMLTVIARPVRLSVPEEVDGLRLVIEEKRPALVVLDTWHRMTPGIEENNATETGVPLGVALGLRDDYATTVLVVHHTGHQQKHARGSSSLEDDADASWIIRLGSSEDAEDRGPSTPRTLIHRKSKDGELADDVRLVLTVDDEDGATVSVDPFAAPAQRGRRGRPSKADQREAQVAELIGLLDDAELGLGLGVRSIHEWRIERNYEFTDAVVREAAKRRRERESGSVGTVAAVAPPKGAGATPRRPEQCGDNVAETPSALSPADMPRGDNVAETPGGVVATPPANPVAEMIVATADEPVRSMCPDCRKGRHMSGSILCTGRPAPVPAPVEVVDPFTPAWMPGSPHYQETARGGGR